MTATVNLKKGAVRVWLVATIFWITFAAFESREGISYWVGYHWSLYSRNDSIGAALRNKSRTKNLILACDRARESQCETPPPRRVRETGRLIEEDNPYLEFIAEHIRQEEVCLNSPQFLATVIAEATKLREPDARGIKNGAVCAGYAVMTVPPEIDWFAVIAVLLVPVLPILVYVLGFWLYRGFVT